MTTLIEVIEGDITKVAADAIVNAANRALVPGGGVDGAIHRAGGPSIRAEAEPQGPLATGRAVITTAGDLPARWVIHTVGPIWGEASKDEAVRLLTDCYVSSLELAADHDCRSITFPNISTGVYGFPKPLAAESAVDAVTTWIAAHKGSLNHVGFVCFDDENLSLYEGLLASS